MLNNTNDWQHEQLAFTMAHPQRWTVAQWVSISYTKGHHSWRTHGMLRCAHYMQLNLWDTIANSRSISLLIISYSASTGLEVHRLSADNRYQPFDNWHRPIIGISNRHRSIIGRLFVLVSKTTKMLLTAVHIGDNEVTNDSVISHVSSSTFNRTK